MTTPQSYARRLEKQARRGETLDASGIGECSCCSWWHLYPLERRVCPVCGQETCLGLGWVCECGEVVAPSPADGKLRDATEKAGNALAGVPARGDISTPSKRRS